MTIHLTIPLTEETEAQLRNIMEVRGLDSLEAAVNYAFAEGEEKACANPAVQPAKIRTRHFTIVLTEENAARLRNIMEKRGLDSLEAAADYAFVESERAAGIKKLYDNLLPDEAWGDAFDPASARESLRGPENFPHSRNDAAA